jgi:DNA polymerase-3 subunit epsilon
MAVDEIAPESSPDPSPATPADTPEAAIDLGHLGPRFSQFASELRRPVVFFDIEATGTDPLSDRIVEISLVRIEPGGSVGNVVTRRINPEVRIPLEATEIHGITNEDLASSPTFAELAEEIMKVVEGADLAGFAIGRFDVRLLHAELVRAGRAIDFSQTRVIDAQVIYHRREPRHLSAALQFYRGKELEGAHGALADTLASLEVFAGQLERYDDLHVDVEQLHQLSASHNDAYCDLGRRFMWRDNEPVFNFGRMRGKTLRWVAADPDERKYLRWFLDGTFEEDAKSLVREALTGKIRLRQSPA